MKNIKLIDLWYLDGNYNLPIKVKGFKTQVKTSRYFQEEEGYVYIEPSSNAFLVASSRDSIFDSEELALIALKKQVSEHLKYAKEGIEKYNKDIEKFSSLLDKK